MTDTPSKIAPQSIVEGGKVEIYQPSRIIAVLNGDVSLSDVQ